MYNLGIYLQQFIIKNFPLEFKDLLFQSTEIQIF